MACIEQFSSECRNRCLLFIAGLFVFKKRKSYQYLFHLILRCNHEALLNMNYNYTTVSTMTSQYRALFESLPEDCAWVHVLLTGSSEFTSNCSRIIEVSPKKAEELSEAQIISKRRVNIQQSWALQAAWPPFRLHAYLHVTD